MTQLLEQVIAKLTDLPPADQDAIAAVILEELKDEQRWAAPPAHRGSTRGQER